MSTKRWLVLVMAIMLLLMLCACRGAETSDIISQTPGASATAEPQPPTENTSGQESSENVRITFITQKYYEGGDIVEIPYFEYDGAKNDVIDGINRLFNQGLQTRYEEFGANSGSYEWIEIRTYPFTDEWYAQVVVTSIAYCMYPDFRWSGTVESVNYDKLNNKWIQFSDLGIKEDDILAGVRKLYMLEKEDAVIDSAKVAGFLLRPQGGEIGNFTEILLEITTSGGDLHTSFYSYCPDTGEFCLFDPTAVVPFNHADMDHMEPPLYYDLLETQTGGEPIAGGVIYAGSLLEGDPGDNMHPYEAASGLYDAALRNVLGKGSDYSEKDPMYITCVAVMEIDGGECYQFEVNGSFGNKTYAVNYDYDNQNVYEVSEGVSKLIGSILDLGRAKAYE